jgi:hypothetical protein
MSRQRIITSVICLGLIGACDRSSSSEESVATPFSADGTVTLDGKSDSIKSCDLQGAGIDQAIVLGLASGAVFTMPLHDSKTQLRRTPDAEATDVECKLARSTESSNVWLKSSIEGSCTGDGVELELALELECGTKGFSNEKPSNKD